MKSTSPNILFIDNGTNYILFLRIATLLQERGSVKFVFVTLIESRVKLFREMGVEAVYLDLSRKSSGTDLSEAEKIISSLESQYPNFRLGVGVRRDRILRYLRRARSRRILLTAALRFSDLLNKYRPLLVLGEISWAIEYLFHYLSESKGVPYRHILNIPGRSLRVTGFDDRHTYASTVKDGPVTYENSAGPGKSYAELCNEVKLYKVSVRYFVQNFRLNYSGNDYRQSLLYRARRAFIPLYKVVNSLFYCFYARRGVDSTAGNILLTLHIQPESTPDFVSPFYADQLQLARGLLDALRSDQVLYIKDHPNTVSIRNLFALADLLKHPQVRLLPQKFSAKAIYHNFDCVVSVAGTALLECSELGVPALCLSDVYLGELPGVLDARKFSSLAEALDAAISYVPPESDGGGKVREICGRLGFPGFIHDARVSPQVLDSGNVECLVRLVEHMIDGTERSPKA